MATTKRREKRDKFKRAKQYIDNNLGQTEFLALCYDLYDFEHGVNNKPSGPFNKTLDVLGMWDETDSVAAAIMDSAHKMFGKMVFMLLEDNVTEYLDYDADCLHRD